MIVQANARRLPLASGCATLALTDPPYAVMTNANIDRGPLAPIVRNIGWDNMTEQQWIDLMLETARSLFRVCAPNATAYVFGSDVAPYWLRETFQYAGWKYRITCYWQKTNPAPKVHLVTYQAAVEPFAMFTKGRNVFNVENGGLAHNVFRYPTPMGPERVHPTQKPVGLLEELIRNSSQPGDLVVDPYCGSGSTGEAARRMDRRFYGSDLDWTYLTHYARFKAERAVSSAGLEHLPLFGGPLDSAS